MVCTVDSSALNIIFVRNMRNVDNIILCLLLRLCLHSMRALWIVVCIIWKICATDPEWRINAHWTASRGTEHPLSSCWNSYQGVWVSFLKQNTIIFFDWIFFLRIFKLVADINGGPIFSLLPINAIVMGIAYYGFEQVRNLKRKIPFTQSTLRHFFRLLQQIWLRHFNQ